MYKIFLADFFPITDLHVNKCERSADPPCHEQNVAGSLSKLKCPIGQRNAHACKNLSPDMERL
jgi:hypothetical protein